MGTSTLRDDFGLTLFLEIYRQLGPLEPWWNVTVVNLRLKIIKSSQDFDVNRCPQPSWSLFLGRWTMTDIGMRSDPRLPLTPPRPFIHVYNEKSFLTSQLFFFSCKINSDINTYLHSFYLILSTPDYIKCRSLCLFHREFIYNLSITLFFCLHVRLVKQIIRSIYIIEKGIFQ